MATQRFAVADPGASSLVFTVPNGFTGRWRALSIFALITTDATVATRLFGVSVADAEGNEYAAWTASQTQVASQAYKHCWQHGMNIQAPNASGSAAVVHMCMPAIELDEGDTITIADIAAAAAGDRITDVVIVLEPIE